MGTSRGDEVPRDASAARDASPPTSTDAAPVVDSGSDLDGAVLTDGSPGEVAPDADEVETDGGPLGPIRLLPLGDSITQGAGGHQSFRRPLFRQLAASGIDVDFVGSLDTNHGGANPYDDFDPDHEGHWGWRADQLLADLPSWLSRYTPDLALVHVGTNDCFQGQSVGSTLDEVRQIILALRDANPLVVVLVAQLIDSRRADANRCIHELNVALRVLAEEVHEADISPVLVVDHNSGFDASSLLYDDAHPNEEGERRMAERWHDAIVPIAASVGRAPVP